MIPVWESQYPAEGIEQNSRIFVVNGQYFHINRSFFSRRLKSTAVAIVQICPVALRYNLFFHTVQLHAYPGDGTKGQINGSDFTKQPIMVFECKRAL